MSGLIVLLWLTSSAAGEEVSGPVAWKVGPQRILITTRSAQPLRALDWSKADGELLAVVLSPSGEQLVAVTLMRDGSHSLQRLSLASGLKTELYRGGYMNDPTFSADEKQVLFAHYPKGGGPMGRHEPQSYAQIFRVGVNGGTPEQLTGSLGCHGPARELGPGELLMIHADCRGGRRLETLKHETETQAPGVAGSWRSNTSAFDVAQDGAVAAAVEKTAGVCSVVARAAPNASEVVLGSAPCVGGKIQVYWERPMRSALLSVSGRLFRVEAGKAETLRPISDYAREIHR